VTDENTNFSFLDRCDDRVAHLARQAEHYVHSDPDSCLFKLRLMIETMAKRLVSMSAPDMVDADLSSMLGILERLGTLPRRQADGMHAIRRDGNAAVHGNSTPTPTAMRRLKDAHGLSGWYARNIRRGSRVDTGNFVPPPAPYKAGGKESDLNSDIEALEDRIEGQRRRTREALMLFREDEDPEGVRKRYRVELKALEMVAAAAGEPMVDAEFVALVMAMDLEALFEHPAFGSDSREARRNAESQLATVKAELERNEQDYLTKRADLVQEMRMYKRRQLRGEI
jgi:type I restriction enzyme R subunit